MADEQVRARAFRVDGRDALALAEWAEPQIGRIAMSHLPGLVLPFAETGRFAAVSGCLKAMRAAFPDLVGRIAFVTCLVLQYEPGKGFGRHNDANGGTLGRHRLMSASVQLNNSYTGGRFRYWPSGSAAATAEHGRGSGVAFRAEVDHEVTAVTSGTRLALVTWAWGHTAVDKGRQGSG